MNRIVEHLSDPAWWFATVFVAVLTSMVASFLKDALLSALAKVSSRYKERKQKRDQKIEQEVREALSDPFLLVLTFCKVIVQTCLIVALVTIYIVAYFLFLTLPKNADIMTKLILGGMVLFTGGALLTILMLRYTPRVRVLRIAYRRYRNRVLENASQQQGGQVSSESAWGASSENRQSKR